MQKGRGVGATSESFALVKKVTGRQRVSCRGRGPWRPGSCSDSMVDDDAVRRSGPMPQHCLLHPRPSRPRILFDVAVAQALDAAAASTVGQGLNDGGQGTSLGVQSRSCRLSCAAAT